LLHRVRESEQLWVELERIATREGLQERMIDPLFNVALGLRVRRSTYLSMLAEPLSDQAAGRDLRILAERGLTVPHGEKRGRYYTGSEELLGIWRSIRAKRSPREADPFALQ
jgi:hypothetical protein